MDSDFWCLKGSQPLSHFCFVFVRCHENSDKDYFIPLFHGITSISPAVCSALLNCCDSPRIRLQHFSLDKSRMRGCRGDARYQCDGEEGVSSRGTDITLLHWRRQVRLNLWRSFIICGATTESEASEQQRHCTGVSVFFYHPPSPLCFLSVFSCLFLLSAAPWSACQRFRRLCSLSKWFSSGCQWNFVSVSQLSSQSPTHLSDTAVTLCLLIKVRLRGDSLRRQLSFHLFGSDSLWNNFGASSR